MAERATQRNNGSPKGYGQPDKKRQRQVLLRPEDQQLAPDEGEMRLIQEEAAPSVYPQQPVYQPRGRQGRVEDQGVRTGVTGAVNAPQGQNPYSRVGAGQFNPSNRNSGQPTNHGYGQPPPQPGNGSTGAQGVVGVPNYNQNPAHMGGSGYRGGGSMWDQLDSMGATQGAMAGQPQGVLPGEYNPQFPSSIAQAANQAMQNGYTDIEGAQGYFQPGNFMSQLSGFNTGGWNTGERGTQTLKNTMGQLFSNYDVTQPGALAKVVQDPKLLAMYPNATVGGPKQDLLDLDGPDGPMEPVDVIQAAGENGAGTAWAWMPTAGGGLDQAQLGGPGGPSAMAYQQALLAGVPLDGSQAPQVMDENTAMQFLQYLLQQQQQGQQGQQFQGLI